MIVDELSDARLEDLGRDDLLPAGSGRCGWSPSYGRSRAVGMVRCRWLRSSWGSTGRRCGCGWAAAEDDGRDPDDAERIRELEREVKQLRRANKILRSATAYFAQAELDRQHK